MKLLYEDKYLLVAEKFAVSSGGGRLFFAFRLSVRRISILLSDTAKGSRLTSNAERAEG